MTRVWTPGSDLEAAHEAQLKRARDRVAMAELRSQWLQALAWHLLKQAGGTATFPTDVITGKYGQVNVRDVEGGHEFACAEAIEGPLGMPETV